MPVGKDSSRNGLYLDYYFIFIICAFFKMPK